MSIAVVTDSTASLPEGYAERYSVRSVPLHVNVAGVDTFRADTLGAERLTALLETRHRVTTAGPSSAEFSDVYREELDSGADGIVSVHLSSSLSGTWQAARLAASEVDETRIRVVDSRCTAMGLGFAVLAAASGAAAGADLAEVESLVLDTAGAANTVFSVRTLEYLRRGGRIGSAAALLGTALAIKPLLRVHDGHITALEKVRTNHRAVTRLIEIAVAAAGSGVSAIAVQHLAAPERASKLAYRIRQQLPECQDCVVSEVDPVIGAHIGPGALGVVSLPGGWEQPGR